MSIVWSKTNETRTGKMVRQSYTAAVADGLLCREVVLYDEGPSTQGTGAQAPDPGSRACRILAEDIVFVPTANGAPTVWVQESQTVSGERVDTLYSNALATSKTLYMQITTTQEAAKAFPQGSSAGAHKSATLSLMFMS